MRKKRDDSKLIKEKHDHKLNKERGLGTRKREGKLSMERIKWKGLVQKTKT
jgi:hypothetical protein